MYISNLLLVAAVLGQAGGTSRSTSRPAADELVTRVYRIDDLVLSAPDYAFGGIELPGFPGSVPRIGGSPGAGLGGGGFGGGGFGGGGFGGQGGGGGGGGFGGQGGGGGGFFQVPDGTSTASSRAPFRFGREELIAAIQAHVWPTGKPEGRITSLGSMLIATQSVEAHKKIQSLLDDLRKQGGTLRSLTLRANWLLLDRDGAKQLADATATSRELDPKLLARLADNGQGYSGEITCFDGQTVHILSGQLKSIIQSVIPVVGDAGQASAENLARADEQNAIELHAGTVDLVGAALGGALHRGVRIEPVQVIERNVGHQPVIGVAHSGTLLQVTPSLMPDGRTALIDLQSYFSGPNRATTETSFKGVIALDKINVDAQQFKTTTHIPLERPVLVGGMTLVPGSKDEGAWQLHLVIEARVADKPQARSERR